MITINRVIVDRNTTNLPNIISNYLNSHQKPLPAIKDFILIFSRNALSNSVNTIQFHYMYTSPNKLRFINFYTIDASELSLSNNQNVFIIESPNVMIFSDRSFYGFMRRADTQIVINSYPDEQGYSIKVMKKWTPQARTNTSCEYKFLYLIGRLFKLDFSPNGFNPLDLQKYYNMIFYQENNSEIVKNIFQSFSWTFEILLPFRVEINDIIPDDNFGLLR